MPRLPQHPEPYTAERYFAMVEEGLISPDDKVELLDGLIVAMAPQSPEHASAVYRVTHVLERAVGHNALVRAQSSFLASELSVPEPDVCVIEGSIEDYDHVHPSAALLVVEIASTSLASDRLTKSRIYAAAGIPEYWIVNLRERTVEIYTQPDGAMRVYAENATAREGDMITLRAVHASEIAAGDLFPVSRD